MCTTGFPRRVRATHNRFCARISIRLKGASSQAALSKMLMHFVRYSRYNLHNHNTHFSDISAFISRAIAACAAANVHKFTFCCLECTWCNIYVPQSRPRQPLLFPLWEGAGWGRTWEFERVLTWSLYQFANREVRANCRCFFKIPISLLA